MIKQNLWMAAAVALSSFAGAGCSNLAVRAPDPLVESPELPGRAGAFEFSTGLEDATRYEFSADASARPPNLATPSAQSSADAFGRGGYSPLPWLEIAVNVYPFDVARLLLASAGVMARAQVVGSGAEPGWKASVYAGVLQAADAAGGNQNGTLGPAGYNWRADARARTLSAGGSVGYRFADPQLLLFAALSYADQRLWGEIDQDKSDNGQDLGGTYGLPTVQASTRAAALGARWGRQVQFGLDWKLLNRDWPRDRAGGGAPETEGVVAIRLLFQTGGASPNSPAALPPRN